MSETAAVVIATIEAGRVTDDGTALLLKVRQPDGRELILALPAAQLTALVDMAAMGHTECRRLAGVDPDQREAYATTWWELARDQASSSVILSLTFGSGGRLDFLLDGRMPAQMLETLEVLTGRSTPIAHGTRPN
jgi:hypothetical protein